MRPNRMLIDLKDVSKVFRTDGRNTTVLRNVFLQVEAGESVSIVGSSGSGKSTLLNMIAGIDRPTQGEVTVVGHSVHALSENQLARWRGRTVGVIFQFFQLLPTLSVVENVMLPMDFGNVYPHRQRQARALALLEQVGMAGQADKLPRALSGGEQQRVAFARALANDPPLLLADEPTGNLDSTMAESVFTLFEQRVRAGKTLLMVTHDQALAARLSRIVRLRDGQVVSDQSTALAEPTQSEDASRREAL
jgi:putative ABC transport system ATP-binding protein